MRAGAQRGFTLIELTIVVAIMALATAVVIPSVSNLSRADLRHLSPRQMQELALDFYAEGLVSFEDYAVLAFQPELHPRYNATVGALTGEAADPDRPRDFIRRWEDRLAFERRHNPENAPLVQQTRRILEMLTSYDAPTDVSI